jgi:chromosome segregation ATPase
MAVSPSLLSSLQASSRRLYLQTKFTGPSPALPLPCRPDIIPKTSIQSDKEEVSEKLDYETLYREEKMSREYAERQWEEAKEKLQFYEELEEELKAVKREKETVIAELEAERSRNSAKAAQISRAEADHSTLILALKAQIAASASEITSLKAQLSNTTSHLTQLQSTFESLNKDQQSIAKALQSALKEEQQSKRSLELLYAELYDAHQASLKGANRELEERLQVLETKVVECGRTEDQETTLHIGHYVEKKQNTQKKRTSKHSLK